MADDLSAVALAWKLVFNEEYEEIPDPNKPENTAYFNARQQERKDSIKRFLNGSGKVLYDRWNNDIKKETMSLLFMPKEKYCTCAACLILRDLRSKVEMVLEAEKILHETKG